MFPDSVKCTTQTKLGKAFKPPCDGTFETKTLTSEAFLFPTRIQTAMPAASLLMQLMGISTQEIYWLQNFRPKPEAAVTTDETSHSNGRR